MLIDEKTILAKIIKTYLLCKPDSTARDIHTFLTTYEFGFQISISPMRIAKLIQMYNADEKYRWFRVKNRMDNYNRRRYKVVEYE